MAVADLRNYIASAKEDLKGGIFGGPSAIKLAALKLTLARIEGGYSK